MPLHRSIKVGVPVSLTGQFRTQGEQVLAGLQAWAEDANVAGGIGVDCFRASLPVSVVYYDDASNPARVREVTERLIAMDHVDLLMGPYSGALVRAASQVAETHGMLLWNQGGASDNVYRRGNRWVVGILTPASEYLAGLLPMVRENDPHAATLAVLRASSGEFPRAVTSGVERAAIELGFRVVLLREYDPSQIDFGEIVGLVQGARPHVLVAVGRIDNDLALARELADRSPAIGVVAVVATPIQQFQDALGVEAEGFLGPSQWEPGTDRPEDYGPSSREVLESLGRGGHPDPDYPMVQAYAAGLVAQRCVEAAGTLESAALRETAGDLDFSTFYGRFKIDPATGRQIGRPVVIVQWQGGRKVVVWPPERSQSQLQHPWRGAGLGTAHTSSPLAGED